MGKLIKYIVLSLACLILISSAVIFLKPSILLNKKLLVKTLSAVAKPADIFYKDINFNISSQGILDKRIRFSAKEFCIKNKTLNLYLPDIDVDFVLKAGLDKLRIVRIDRFAVDSARVTLDIPANYRIAGKNEAKPPPPDTTEVKGNPSKTGISLFLRFLNLFSDISRKEMNLSVKNLLYDINFKDAKFNGTINLEGNLNTILFKINNLFNGNRLDISVIIDEGSSIGVSFNNKLAVKFDVRANMFFETLEYLRNKELFLYKKNSFRAELDIEDIKTVLKILDAFTSSKYSNIPIDGHINSKMVLNLNFPNIDDAVLNMDISGVLNDHGSLVDFAGNLNYYFYQKIPTVEISRLDIKNTRSTILNDYYSYKFLSHLGEKLYCQIKYRWSNNRPEIIIKKDYSKLPKRVY